MFFDLCLFLLEDEEEEEEEEEEDIFETFVALRINVRNALRP